MKELTFEELSPGMTVQDDDGDIGIINDIEDIHNISIEYEKNGGIGYGFVCLDENCMNKDRLYLIEEK